MLLFEERNVLCERHGKGVGNIQAGEGTLFVSGFERVLRRKLRIARGGGSEDLAHVVQVLAECITGPDGQLLEQIVGAELSLQSVVGREPAVVAGTYNTQTASDATHIRGSEAEWPALGGCCASRSWSAWRQQGREVLQQAMGGRGTQIGVPVHCLVQVPAEVSNIARFEHG